MHATFYVQNCNGQNTKHQKWENTRSIVLILEMIIINIIIIIIMFLCIKVIKDLIKFIELVNLTNIKPQNNSYLPCSVHSQVRSQIIASILKL